MPFVDDEDSDGVNFMDPVINDSGKKPRIKQFMQRKLCSKYLQCNEHDV